MPSQFGASSHASRALQSNQIASFVYFQERDKAGFFDTSAIRVVDFQYNGRAPRTEENAALYAAVRQAPAW